MGLLKSLPIGPVTISRRIMFLKTHGNISVKLGLFDQSGLRPNPHPPPPPPPHMDSKKQKKKKEKSFFGTTHDSNVFMDSKSFCVIVHGQQRLLCYCSWTAKVTVLLFTWTAKSTKKKKKGYRSSSKIYDFF
jgi:hypothetical protein